MINLYEIYTYNEEAITTGCYAGQGVGTVSGWDIKWVLSSKENIKSFPFFDCIISINDGFSTASDNTIIEWSV